MTIFLLAMGALAVVIVGGTALFADEPRGLPVMIAVAVWLLVVVGWWALAFSTEATVTFRVASTERIAEDNDGKWIVEATRGETFQNTDALFHGKTRSTHLQHDIQVGHVLRCKVNGYRSGFLSGYRNLLACRDLTTGRELRR